MTLFGAMFFVLMWENHSARTVFRKSARDLLLSIGMINTLVLLVSSYLVVAASWAHRRDERSRSMWLVLGAVGCAAVFATLKAVEYSLALADGHTANTNLFFTFYFVLTGLHLLHVIVGSGLLIEWSVLLRRGTKWSSRTRLFEGVAVYWHMVDLLWIAIVTLVYLACAA
jgi:nitric oxide reductase NorE protein